MSSHFARTVTVTLLALVLTAGASSVSAQMCTNTGCTAGMCMVSLTAPSTPTTMGGMVYCTVVVYGAGFNGTRGAAVSAACAPSAAAGSIFPGQAPLTYVFTGTKTPAAAAPVCSWDVFVAGCNGGGVPLTCSVDSGDGLPVELMDFEVESQPD